MDERRGQDQSAESKKIIRVEGDSLLINPKLMKEGVGYLIPDFLGLEMVAVRLPNGSINFYQVLDPDIQEPSSN